MIWRDYYSRMGYGKIACTHCRLKKASENTLKDRQESLYSRAVEFCNECGYKLLTPKEKIFTSDTRVDYLCPIHGIHNVKIYTLITKHRCIDCMHEIGGNNQRLDIDDIVDYINECGSTLLNPSDYTRSTDKNLWVICPECGEKFITSFFSFRKHGGQRCPECTNLESHGERRVREWLENNNISFIPQYRFYDCRTTVPLPFDFYLNELNILIEYDGAGHYIPIRRGQMTYSDAVAALEQTQKRDTIKTDYCNANNIQLIRIPYWDFDNIEIILTNKLLNLHEDIV